MEKKQVPEEIKMQYDKAAMAMDNKKNYDYAIELLTQIINIRPDFAKGRQLLRLAQIKKFDENRPNAFVYALRKIISSVRLLAELVSEAKGDHGKAMSICENILKNDPKNTAVMFRLGNLLRIEGLKEASAVTLESAINISQKNPAAYELLGEIYSELGNYGRARSCFKKVLESKPHDANAERGIKNLDALTTIDRSFETKDGKDFKIRDITE